MKLLEKLNNYKPIADPFSPEAIAYGRKLEADKNEIYIKATTQLREIVMPALSYLYNDNKKLKIGTTEQRVYKFKIASDCDYILFNGCSLNDLRDRNYSGKCCDDNIFEGISSERGFIYSHGSKNEQIKSLVDFKFEGYYPIPWSESYKNYGIIYILLETICPELKQLQVIKKIDVIVTQVLDRKNIHRVIATVAVTYEVTKPDFIRNKRM